MIIQMYKLLPIIFLFYAKRLKKTDILQPVMKLSTSYSQILSLSVPIMLGSAAQNIIVLSDNVFLYHYNSMNSIQSPKYMQYLLLYQKANVQQLINRSELQPLYL